MLSSYIIITRAAKDTHLRNNAVQSLTWSAILMLPVMVKVQLLCLPQLKLDESKAPGQQPKKNQSVNFLLPLNEILVRGRFPPSVLSGCPQSNLLVPIFCQRPVARSMVSANQG